MKKMKVKAFLSAAKNILLPLAKMFLGKNMVKDIAFGIGELSCTNGKVIQVQLTEQEIETLPKEDLMRILKFKMYHECSHVLFTGNNDFEAISKEMADYFVSDAESKNLHISKAVAFKIAMDIVNSLEDGRIENLLCVLYPGLKKHRDWYRIRSWYQYVMPEKCDPFIAIRNDILDLSTMGMHCNGFVESFPEGTEVYEVIDQCLPYISGFITSKTLADAGTYAVSIAEIVSKVVTDSFGMTDDEWDEYLQKKKNDYSLTPEEEEKLREILEAIENGTFNFPDQPQGDSPDIPDEIPLVGIIPENDEEVSQGQPGKTPKVIIDLRKNPPKSNNNEKGNGEENGPRVIRPNAENQDSSEEENSGKGQENNNSAGESSEKNISEGNGAEKEDSGEEDSDEKSGNSGGKSQTPDNKDLEGEEQEGSSGCSRDFDDEDMGEKSGISSENSQTPDDKDLNGEDQEDSGGCSQDSDAGESDNASEGSDNCSEDDSGDAENNGDGSDSRSTSQMDKSQGRNPYNDSSRMSSEAAKEKLDDLLKENEEDYFSEQRQEMRRLIKEEEAFNRVEDNAEPLAISKEDLQDIENLGFGNSYSFSQEKPLRRAGCKCPPDIEKEASRFRQRLMNIILSKQESDRREMFEGEVDEDDLAKFITGKSDFFCMEGREVEAEVAAIIIKDDSGSMCGINEERAIQALTLCEESFKGIPGFSLSITTFSETCGEYHKIIKDWNDNDPVQNYTTSYAMAGNRPGGSNNDAYAISIATKQLLKRPEKSKLLIVISDGLPCCPMEMVTKAVKLARKQGIFVISLFMGSPSELKSGWESYRVMYENYFCGVQQENLSNALYNLMRKFVETSV